MIPPSFVRICAFSVTGSNGDRSRFRSDLSHARVVYRNCGLTLLEGSFTQVNNSTLLDFPTWTDTHVPQAALRLLGLGRACQPGVVVFYVRSMGEGVVGRGGPHFVNGSPGLIVTDSASPNTFAHELGHAFLGGDEAHSPDQTNVMFSPSGAIRVNPPRVTAAQCERIAPMPHLTEAPKSAADPVVRLTAATALSRSRNPLVEPILIACTHDADPGVRLAGLRGLSTQGTVSAMAAMVRALMGEQDHSVRAAAIRLLLGGEV